MNGVRRFLSGAGSTPEPVTPPAPPTAPLVLSGRPSWPPSPPHTQSPTESFENFQTTSALSFRKEKKPTLPPDDDLGNLSFQSSRSSNGYSSRQGSMPQSPGAGPSSPRVPPLPTRVSQLSRKSTGSEWKRSSQMMNIRDDLLMSLLASEAIVDSRGYDILSAEEVEELKKEQQVLTSRLVAMNKKLVLETKIRDAALSLSKANATYKNVTKQTSEQLDSANRKVELAQKELWKVSERANEVSRKLLEHRAGVLSQSVRTLEKKTANGDESTTSGFSTPNRSSQMSPTSSVTSIQTASSKGRFDGAHFFAGHSDTIIPQSPKPPQWAAAAVAAVAASGTAELEEKLQELTAALEAATARQTEMEQELSLVRMEKEEIETSLGMQLHGAQDTISSMKNDLSRMDELDAQLQAMEEERESWNDEQRELEEQRQTAEALRRRAEEELEARSADTSAVDAALEAAMATHAVELEKRDREVENLRSMWESDRATWELEKVTLMGDMNDEVNKLQQNAASGTVTKSQLDGFLGALNSLMQAHNIQPVASPSSPSTLVASLSSHLEDVKRRLDEHAQVEDQWSNQRAKLETDVRLNTDKREALAGELDRLRRERDEAQAEARDLQLQLQAQVTASAAAVQAAALPPVEYKGDVEQIIAQLQPIWAVLPSAEARASKLGSRGFRNGSPTQTTPRGVGGSLSEMDVRSLKNLYDPKGYAISSNLGKAFTVEAFVERIQSLIADDRALIERLIRFAQAHDLLKKNAERAQKLAQDSNAALETYQRQVNTLEDRNILLMKQQAQLQDELHFLQETIERVQAEKLEIESQAAEQAETCAQLTEANNKLSARALIMADEAASNTDSVRRQLESQVAECKTQLSRVKEELESTQQSQQTQQMALLEELNSMQTENTNLRNQLRGKK